MTEDFMPIPRREPGVLTRSMSRMSKRVASVEAMRSSHADFWDEWNNRAFNETGPLWIALGDSTSQGIGAPDPREGWVPKMLDRVRAETGEPWRVINLSVTGAQLGDILELQLPRVNDLRAAGHAPAVVSHLAGANDMISMTAWTKTPAKMKSVLEALPAHSVVARVGEPFPKGGFMSRIVNRRIEQQAAVRPFHLFWPWRWPSRDGLAADKWHPGPKGYSYMVDLIWEPMQAALAHASEHSDSPPSA